MSTKKLALLAAALLMATLTGCGSSRSSDGSVTSPGNTVQPGTVGSASCEVCHSAVVAQGWSGSLHDTAAAGCEGCHGGGQFHKGVGPIPNPSPSLDAQCVTCHPVVATRHIAGDDPATPTVVEGYVKVEDCLGCHSAKTPAGTTWQHNPSSTEINKQWALSGHAGRIASATPDTESVWGHYNWDQVSGSGNRASCQRCHTATGAMNFLNGPASYNAANNDFSHLEGWTAATGSGQNELLFCWGCHSDVATGTLRNPGAITEVYSGTPSVTIAYPDAQKSNVCMGCHLGREVGGVIAASTLDFSNLSFINSHYLAAGGMVFGESGYEYAGQTYTKTFTGHAGAGSANGQGPCVSCHMNSSEAHTFEVVQKDAAGVITGIASTSCGECHGNMNAAWLEERKETFEQALDTLKQALLARGIEFSPNYPYFYVAGTTTAFKNWDGVNVGTVAVPITGKGKDVMGAAFNFNLLEHDPGAYAHNRSYALKLVTDSIDFLADGAVDGSGVFADFPAAGTNSDLLADASAIKAVTLEAKHFGGTVLKQAQFVSNASQPVSCADCHAGGNTTANGAIVDEYAESAHGSVTGDAWLHYDWRSASRAACARCHVGTTYVAKLGIETNTTNIFNGTTDNNLPGETLNCSACHTDLTTGAVRNPGQYTETYNDGGTFTFPDVGKSNLCVRCHSGRESGGTIKADTDADGVRGFINSHYLSAGGTVFGTTGYHYTGLSYANPVFYQHDKIGIAVPAAPTAADAGPCAGCHMGTGTADHTWDVVAKDANGVITAVKSNTCTSCHSGMTADVLETEALHYHAALDALKAQLDARGIYFFNANPYFFTAPYVVGGTNTSFTNWAGVAVSLGLPAVPGYKDVMGAAFNYNLLEHDPGAFAHNRYYAKRLIFDAIDFLDNGVLDGTISVTGDAAVYLGTTRP